MEGYKFSDLLKLVIEISFMTLLTEIRRANVNAFSKAEGREWIVKWAELSGLL